MSPRTGRGTGFAKWPALVELLKDGHPVPCVRSDGEPSTKKVPRALVGRRYMNKRGQWRVQA